MAEELSSSQDRPAPSGPTSGSEGIDKSITRHLGSAAWALVVAGAVALAWQVVDQRTQPWREKLQARIEKLEHERTDALLWRDRIERGQAANADLLREIRRHLMGTGTGAGP